MQSIINEFSNIFNHIFNIAQGVYDNTEFITNTNSIMEFIAYVFAFLVFIYNILKFIKSYRAKNLLKFYLTKDEFKNLKYYVTTHAQLTPPVDTSDQDKKCKRFNLTKFFIKDVFQKDMYGKFFIILGESGMGKSTFLQKLYLQYKRKIFRHHKIYFYPLSNELDISQWEQIENKHNSILLLDALDEDHYALDDYEKRIDEITKASHAFYKVIITCRTQFFPNEESEPNSIPLIRYGTKSKKLEFFKIYISVFNNSDINKYLSKRYKFHVLKIIQAKKIIEKSTDLMARPLLLSYIDDLLKDPVTYSCTSDIYEKLIHEWLCREPCNEELLAQFTNRVMHYMFEHNISYVTTKEISALCKDEEIEVINPILARTRSLLARNSKNEYKFAHKSIYEYLVSYEAVYKDVTMRKSLLYFINNIDLRFYHDMSIKYAKEGHFDLSLLDFVNSNMSDIDLSGKNLTGANLSAAHLTRTNLTYANLTDVNLIYANLTDANLTYTNLNHADLNYADLTGADLTHADLTHADLTHADLTHTNLTYADLTHADLAAAVMTDAVLIYADLANSNLTTAVLIDAVLVHAVLSHANLTSAVLVGANLTDAILIDAILTDVDLTLTNLTNTIFTDTDLF